MHAGLHLAKQKGWFKEAGVDVQIPDGKGSSLLMRQVAAGGPLGRRMTEARPAAPRGTLFRRRQQRGVAPGACRDVAESRDRPGKGR